MREAEMLKRKEQAEMLEYEKRMHLTNFEVFYHLSFSYKFPRVLFLESRTAKSMSLFPLISKLPKLLVQRDLMENLQLIK